MCVCVCAQLVRKEGDFHTPRLLDEKEMRPSEDMQLKKKNRKSGTPCKVREQEGKGGKVSAGRSVVWGRWMGVVCAFILCIPNTCARAHSLSLGLQVCVFVSKIYYSCIISWSVIFERLSMYVCMCCVEEGGEEEAAEVVVVGFGVGEGWGFLTTKKKRTMSRARFSVLI